MPPLRPVLLAGLLLALNASAQSKAPLAITNATEYANVPYLPAWRYSGEMSAGRDLQMVMDIVVPAASHSPHPVLFVVHGGAWSAGTKDQSVYREVMQFFVDRGYICVGYNYILRPREIFPQVFWDFEDAVRFMRIHADRYRADPTRIGAIGFSAGGWLITSVGHGSGDLFATDHQQSIHLAELWARDWVPLRGFPRPIGNPSPSYPDTYGRLQAISYDFTFRGQYGTGNSPACNRWAGKGFVDKPAEQAVIDQKHFDFELTELTAYGNRGVHVPPLFSAPQKDGTDKGEAWSRDGATRVQTIERIYEFFQEQFYRNPRTPVPEIRPARRLIDDGPVEVSMLLPDPEAEIRYQVLPVRRPKGKQWRGLAEPVAPGAWKNWQTYTGPFTITSNCLVRAVATRQGRRESTVAEAHFLQTPRVPYIVAPDSETLPPATTGQPYEVQFLSDAQKGSWFLAGDLVARRDGKQAHFAYPNNMVFDNRYGTWKGTPTRPGTYWIQVWVSESMSGLARHRDYLWTVHGEDLSGEEATLAQQQDPFEELAYFPGNKHWFLNALMAQLDHRGIVAITQPERDGLLVLVKGEEKSEARAVIETFFHQNNAKVAVEWP